MTPLHIGAAVPFVTPWSGVMREDEWHADPRQPRFTLAASSCVTAPIV